MKLPFIKMNGAGNDFVVFDARKTSLTLTRQHVIALASRNNAVTRGCDQLIIMEPSDKADVFMRIYNHDGGEVDACGNATRCIGWKLIQQKNNPTAQVSIETNSGVLNCRQVVSVEYPPAFLNCDAFIEADMGIPYFKPEEIPVSGEFTAALLKNIAKELGIEAVESATCVGMGNPHVVFFVSKLPTLELLERVGEQIKTIPLFMPQGVNLTIAEISGTAIFAYVYERGAGVTKSCGTAACATAVAAIQLGQRKKNTDIQIQQLQRKAEDLFVRWENKSNHVFLIGPVKEEFARSVEL
jgi:diaminopimelate epimerase